MNKNTHKKYLPVQMAHKLHSPPSVHFSWRMGRSQCLNALPASCSKTCGSLASDADMNMQDPTRTPYPDHPCHSGAWLSSCLLRE